MLCVVHVFRENSWSSCLGSYTGRTNLFFFVELWYFEHFGLTCKSARYRPLGGAKLPLVLHFVTPRGRYAGWLSFVHILKWLRNLRESQCNCFITGRERLTHGALVTTRPRQFWTRCNLAISFSGMLWKRSCNNLTCHCNLFGKSYYEIVFNTNITVTSPLNVTTTYLLSGFKELSWRLIITSGNLYFLFHIILCELRAVVILTN